ncbi:MAG: tetratricopeptide repeat protein [Nitrospirae bacterium]|nr:MAG: tetratricopeptide repeat protein [Nitrospirota bacterium]
MSFSLLHQDILLHRTTRLLMGLGWRILTLGMLLSLLASCTQAVRDPDLPPSASDLPLLEDLRLCTSKAAILSRLPMPFHRHPWGSGEQIEQPASSHQPDHDRFLFFDQDEILVGAVFRYRPGLSLVPYPILRHTLSELTPTAEFFLNTAPLLTGGSTQTAALYRTGDRTTTTQYLVLEQDDAQLLLAASVMIDPYEPLLSTYQNTFLPDIERHEGESRRSQPDASDRASHSEFLARQQFARGEAALFASCGRKDARIAVDAYSQAIAYGLPNPIQTAEAHHRLGLALLDLGRAREAQMQFEQALRIRPNIPEVINHLGSALAQQGKNEEARTQFERAITLRPNYARARYNLAKLLERVDRRRAIEEYETYLALVEEVPEEQRRAALARRRIEQLSSGQ